MLKKIITLRNFGLFQNGVPKAISFDKVTLLYAENGRGKSTIATLLRACSQGDNTKILTKKTIGATEDPDIELLFEINDKDSCINFRNGTWSQSIPDIIIFDSEFVDQNVYSGYEVKPDQRQSLLEFALGGQSVTLKKEIDELAKKIKEENQNRSDIEKKITSFSRHMLIPEFIKLPSGTDTQQQIEDKRKRIEAIKNAQALKKRRNPVLLTFELLDMKAFCNILEKKLTDIQKEAEEIVQKHFNKHKHIHTGLSAIEDWVSQGQAFAKNNDCPFCGQKFEGLILIEAYTSYFNEAYIKLKQEVENLESDIKRLLDENKIDSLEAGISANTACIEAWKDQLKITSPSFDIKKLREDVQNIKKSAVDLIAQKQGQLLEAVSVNMGQNAYLVDSCKWIRH